MLLRRCILPKYDHHLRTGYPTDTKPQAARFDQAIAQSVEHITGMQNHTTSPLDDDGGTGIIRRRIKLPTRKRGWGLRLKTDTAPLAFAAGAAVAIPAWPARPAPAPAPEPREQQHRESKEERLSEIAAVLRHVGSGVGAGASRYKPRSAICMATGTDGSTGTDDTGIGEEEQHNGIKEERLSEIAVLPLRVGSGVVGTSRYTYRYL